MVLLNLPIPPGFIITTEACESFYKNNSKCPSYVMEQIEKHLLALEKKVGKRLGDKNDPLLVAVRSGAAASMPGMMDTVLNLGLNDVTVEGLARGTRNQRFAYDAYRRFITMFSGIVLGIPREHFERELASIKKEKQYGNDSELTADDLKELV